jgi:hypothetical protein
LFISFPSELSSVSLIPVTSSTHRIANDDEVAFKCFNQCPVNMDCSSLTGVVNWFSETNGLLHTNALSYNATSRHLYAFLNESVWTNTLNNPVRFVAFFHVEIE